MSNWEQMASALDERPPEPMSPPAPRVPRRLEHRLLGLGLLDDDAGEGNNGARERSRSRGAGAGDVAPAPRLQPGPLPALPAPDPNTGLLRRSGKMPEEIFSLLSTLWQQLYEHPLASGAATARLDAITLARSVTYKVKLVQWARALGLSRLVTGVRPEDLYGFGSRWLRTRKRAAAFGAALAAVDKEVLDAAQESDGFPSRRARDARLSAIYSYVVQQLSASATRVADAA